MNSRAYVYCFVARPAGASHELLQLRRSAGRSMGGTWQLVSGGIEAGETAWQAAIRELREETGLAPREFFQLDVVNTFYLAAGDSIIHAPMFCAMVEADAKVTLNHESTEFRWKPRSEFSSALMWPGERAAFGELCAEILDDGPAKPFLRIDKTTHGIE